MYVVIKYKIKALSVAYTYTCDVALESQGEVLDKCNNIKTVEKDF